MKQDIMCGTQRDTCTIIKIWTLDDAVVPSSSLSRFLSFFSGTHKLLGRHSSSCVCVFETARLFIDFFFFFLPLIVERMMIRVLCVHRDSHYALVEIAIHSGVNDTLLQTRKYIRTPTEVDIIASTVQFFKMTNNIRKKDKVFCLSLEANFRGVHNPTLRESIWFVVVHSFVWL
jgi:hypothetical protein